jgi:hypothetical protein
MILFSGFGGRKGPNSMGKISTLGVLRLRAIKPSVCDRSAKRFAQDDGFVGGLKSSWLDMQKLLPTACWAKFSRPSGTDPDTL